MAGNKETKELLVGVNEVGIVLLGQFKDGVGLGDFEAFYTKFTQDAVFKATVQAAYGNFQAIPGEIQAFGVAEIIDLTLTQVSYIPKIIDALQAPKAV